MYGINKCGSIRILKIPMTAKHAITQLKENRRTEYLKRIKGDTMSLQIQFNNYAYSSILYTLKSTKKQRLNY